MDTTEKITFNLDTAEREKSYEPFVAAIGDRAITMTDPAELDWKVLLEIEDPAMFLRHAVSEDDRAFLRDQNIPGWKFGKLIEAYMKHYGVDLPGNGNASRF